MAPRPSAASRRYRFCRVAPVRDGLLGRGSGWCNPGAPDDDPRSRHQQGRGACRQAARGVRRASIDSPAMRPHPATVAAAPPRTSMEPTAPAVPPDRLQVLYQVSRSLSSLLDWTELVERMMDLVLE